MNKEDLKLILAFVCFTTIAIVAMIAYSQRVDKFTDQSLKVYRQPIENQRISPRTTTGQLIQETVKE